MNCNVVSLWNRSERRKYNGIKPRRLRILTRGSKQTGGGKQRRYTFSVKKHPITILEAINEDFDNDDVNEIHTFVIYGGPSPERNACFRMELFLDRKTAYLEDLVMPSKGQPLCWDDGYTDARLVVTTAYMLARNKGALTLEFTDNSTKHCSPCGDIRLRLGDFYRLLTGKTWYQSILDEAGAKQVFINDYGFMTQQRFESDNRTASITSWDIMGRNVILPDHVLPSTFIDTSAPGSARQMLQILRNLGYCEFLALHLADFLANSSIVPIFGTSWICNIH